MASPHLLARVGWLRAAVLGANDGILSTTGLMLVIAAANASAHAIMLSGVAALVAGACSMAAGEFVSVSAQADTEKTAIQREQMQLDLADADFLRHHPEGGGDPNGGLRHQDAAQVLGLTSDIKAKPIQAAFASALSFSLGASVPLVLSILATHSFVVPIVFAGSLAALCGLGALGALVSESDVRLGTLRVTTFGLLVMGITSGVGHFFGSTG
jgi:VIT1/CCC1 family predicted Fe2+/Mn2+ transporter